MKKAVNYVVGHRGQWHDKGLLLTKNMLNPLDQNLFPLKRNPQFENFLNPPLS
jgi:hypothetical protein